ncbi:hypothetical protein [Enterobacter hormaechei]|uniref:hypothetical protein n=1 Tax=Enterobacter hormaechei TaxID=158836 RepID=UPI001F4EF271|nr:hypothetical protein [Enterobacter hormaechei]MCH9416695.1 hypothetical protein [Enterobacter hormaechei]
MSTTLKEWLLKTIAELEEERDAVPGAVNEDAAMALAAMKLALASLEAEPDYMRYDCGCCGWETIEDWRENDVCPKCNHHPMGKTPLYTAPPAPVSLTDEQRAMLREMDDEIVAELDEEERACRAAMLQGAEPVTTAYKLPFEQWLSQQTGTIDVECGCVMTEVFFHWLRVAYEAGNSPVIPDGYCIMPLKLTADNGAKGALCGEFHVQYRIVCQSCVGEGCEDCNHTGGWDAEIPVSWDTIKRIHESAVEACALPAAPQQEVK